jgi:calcineurin-like phosphoesterase family protein
MNIFVTADTHYAHRNIVRGITRWMDIDPKTGQEIPSIRNTRDFQTLEEMNDTIIENINKVVKPNDILWHLGDVAFSGDEYIQEFCDRVNCKNVHLLLGNHDHRIQNNVELQKNFLSIDTTYGWPHGKKIGGRRFVMCHFPLFVWENHLKGAFHLHGHCHGSLVNEQFTQRKVMDVGIDTHPEFRPYHIDEIIKILDQRLISTVDHHRNRPQVDVEYDYEKEN